MVLQVEYVSKNDLVPYLNNAKIHTPEQIEQIKKSIIEFGFNDPIAIWGNNEVIEGHGRLLAVMQIDSIELVPIIRLDNLTDEQRRAYMLVHNNLTHSTGFDGALLSAELHGLPEYDLTDFGVDAEKRFSVGDYYDSDSSSISKVKTVVCSHCGKTFYIDKDGNIIKHEDISCRDSDFS